ncbi:WXG100 family type VII secretion target [Nocardia sp. NPDC127579]|uniref:WXG100 family type VII secretion target n=1 Tax=Nocardia sp. NPDC127579 TaxID=3345402 RepID=UPI00364482AB
MGGFRYSPELRTITTDMRSLKVQFENQAGNVLKDTQAVAESMTGDGQEAFNEIATQWQKEIQDSMQILHNIIDAADGALDNAQETDRRIGNGFRGLRG